MNHYCFSRLKYPLYLARLTDTQTTVHPSPITKGGLLQERVP